MSKYLLEIGTEEIPYRFMEDALNQMKNNMEKILDENRISYENVYTYGTPRRLVVLVEGINRLQEDLAEMVKGPSKRIAYNDSMEPSKALLGFARGQGVDIENIIIKEFNGEEYVYANKEVKGIETTKILTKHIPDYIKNIHFPKPMRWGGKNIKFARPIRWLISLLDNEIVEFELEGLVPSNKTRGHRFLGSDNITIENVEEYFTKLKENFVIVDGEKRKELIKTGCEKLAKEKGGNLLKDDELLNQLTYIVEYPTPLIGRIKEEYLQLPKEAIITPMKEHQRYFPVVDDNNKLMPYFIAVRNGNKEHLDTVTKGNEKVLDARLEDAKFFYNEDLKGNLESYVDNLKTIVYQEKLGTLYDKTKRVNELSIEIAKGLELGDETEENIDRASNLAKADLVTKMVNEFTELQGIMGREYAMKSGENEIVSLAIYEHYLPRFAEDELPTTTAGAVISIADKLDTICGCFAIGIQPTGSQDPYGLRRQALGIINIILNKNLDLSLNEYIETSLRIYIENELYFDFDKIKTQIVEFFNGRMKNMFIDKGIRYDVVDAVQSTGNDNITDLVIRLEELNKWVEKEELNEILAAFNRVIKIAEKAESDEIIRDLLQEEEEIQLYKVYREIKDEVHDFIQVKEYDKALDKVVYLRKPIDEFFDNVMVMVDDEELKRNRLALIKNISNIMLQICDLSKISNKG
ncbi:glycine--tRNA ligase subunit beta [Clostridium sp. D2Q-11]|uniref:Glycine--tRNA ligase beta subunit n=1 Tax=Anaeromonas frigoriresistens TaxID=2683708 RepID=A0A942UUZ2_9FIRM|nr:glycine--tRNA ligase subunit beta [Anaeromonas frigoriresistens]MBS4536911.1 glycine--tRNA ligase subunit beta [Anaeromonas frigoriresistens]